MSTPQVGPFLSTWRQFCGHMPIEYRALCYEVIRIITIQEQGYEHAFQTSQISSKEFDLWSWVVGTASRS